MGTGDEYAASGHLLRYDDPILRCPQSWGNPITAPTVIADKGYDAEARVLAPLREAGQAAIIPPTCNRTEQRDYDRDLYEARHLIENFFCALKQFRAIATCNAGFGIINYGPRFAGYLLSAVPLLIMFLFGMWYFIRGLTAGALKA